MSKTTTITDVEFLDVNGVSVKLRDVVTEKDCWYVDKEKRWVLTHRAIQKVADTAGISKTYDVVESENVMPSYKNELEHIVRVTIHCLAKQKGTGCVHDKLERHITVTGEANRLNTPIRGRGYLRKMAEKRAFDIAVLEHLGIYDTTFSEDESETMTGQASMSNAIQLSNVDIELLKTEINSIISVETVPELKKLVAGIKKNKSKYTPDQIVFIEHLEKDRISVLHDISRPDALF